MYIKRQVVMLPTNEKSRLVLSYSNELAINWTYDLAKFDDATYQHLYFLSDEEVDFKKDYVYHVDAAGDRHIIAPNTWVPNPKFAKKVIATSDCLEIQMYNSQDGSESYISELPRSSQAFVEKYVEEYNKGNIITEVLIEYEKYVGKNYVGEFTTEEDFDYNLKVNHKDNTITIRKVKDSWTKEERDRDIQIFMVDYEKARREGVDMNTFYLNWISNH